MNIIKYTRKNMRFTQRNLAIKCKIKQSYISQIENYKKIPSPELLLDISNILNICPLQILQQYLCKNCKFKNKCDIQIIIIRK